VQILQEQLCDDYKSHVYLWEVFIAAYKIFMVLPAPYDRAHRFYFQCGIIVVSLLLHVIVRPYRDPAGNITVAVFSICQGLGALAGYDPVSGEQVVGTYLAGLPTETLQVAFLISFFVSISFVLIFSVLSIVQQIKEHRKRNRVQHVSMSASVGKESIKFTWTERVLIFPIFFVVCIVPIPVMLIFLLLLKLLRSSYYGWLGKTGLNCLCLRMPCLCRACDMYINVFQILAVPLFFVLSWAIFDSVDGTAWPVVWSLSVSLVFFGLSTLPGGSCLSFHSSEPQLF
jgi:hypothetical protein